MPLQAQQIITLACQDAKCPGFTSQAGQFLNAVLQDLYQHYDWDFCRKLFRFTFNSAAGQGSGPYALPADYLRAEVQDGKDRFFYVIQGVPYPLIQITLAEYNWQVQTPGFQSYPYNYATDLSNPTATSAGNLYVWPPASGAYDSYLYYFSVMPDIPTPETSSAIPWFPNTQYLQRSVAGRLMGLTNDNRQADYLGDDEQQYPLGAGTILKQYQRNVKDREGAVQTVGLDRRRWGRPFDRLKNTKQIGWMLAFAFLVLSHLPASAQLGISGTPQTPALLQQEIITNFADNTAGLITPAIARQTFLDMAASFGYILAINSWAVQQNIVGNVGIGSRFANSTAVPDASLEINQNPQPVASLTPFGNISLHVVGPAGNIAPRVLINSFGAPAAFNGVRAEGTPQVPLATAAGVSMYNMNAFGYDSTTYAIGGQYIWQSAGLWSPTNHGTNWLIATTAQGSTTPIVHFQVFADGGVGIGTSAPDPAANNLSVTGVPTGLPSGKTKAGTLCIATDGTFYLSATVC
jgi:hypothetical protein